MTTSIELFWYLYDCGRVFNVGSIRDSTNYMMYRPTLTLDYTDEHKTKILLVYLDCLSPAHLH